VAYLTVEQFKECAVMPADDVDRLEDVAPGFVGKQLTFVSLWIDSRLRKRYKAPFTQQPITELLQYWLSRIVASACYTRRGWDPSGVDAELIIADGNAARAEVLEAADGENGLFELTFNDSLDASAVSKPATRGYSEHSPYVGFSRQADIGRDEDRNGGGTHV
jgi:hypothetical protein